MAGWGAGELLGGAGALAGGVAFVGVTAGVIVMFEPAREFAQAIYQRMIVPHRVRAGLVQAGVANRDGRPPMIVRSRCRRDQARRWVWFPAGVVAGDVEGAASVIEGSCGAAAVEVVPHPYRRDRAVVIVARPRWGWPG